MERREEGGGREREGERERGREGEGRGKGRRYLEGEAAQHGSQDLFPFMKNMI